MTQYKRYKQLSESERFFIYEAKKQGLSQSDIAERIARNKSTVSRELARNSDYIGYLYPRDAQRQTEKRKAKHGFKINRKPKLKKSILKKLKQGWPPTVIAGRLSKEGQTASITHESIYNYIYARENKDLNLWKLLPKRKRKRGMIRKQQSKTSIPYRISIGQRPEEINMRKDIGHYEGDLMFNKGSMSANILTIVERKSRMVTLIRHSSKHSEPIIASIRERIGSFAKSYTFDNGGEFASHHKLGQATYFCDPGAPWQKGSVEHMNGLLRRYAPFSMRHELITQEYLDQIAHKINNTPRKILGFLTPAEVFRGIKKVKSESRVKPARPAVEALSFYQNKKSVALHN